MIAVHSSRAARGHWFPWLFVAFMGLVVVANAVMIWHATRSWTGLVTQSAYDKGLSYNRNLDAAARQAELGWRARLTTAKAAGGATLATFELRDRDGRPLTGADVSAVFQRPSSATLDLTVLLEPGAAGEYETVLTLPAASLWHVHLTARRSEDLYVSDHRLVLR